MSETVKQLWYVIKRNKDRVLWEPVAYPTNLEFCSFKLSQDVNIWCYCVTAPAGIAILKITLFIIIVSYYYLLFSERKYFKYIILNKFTLCINLVLKNRIQSKLLKQRGENHEYPWAGLNNQPKGKTEV